jgi:hypothetical protein
MRTFRVSGGTEIATNNRKAFTVDEQPFILEFLPVLIGHGSVSRRYYTFIRGGRAIFWNYFCGWGCREGRITPSLLIFSIFNYTIPP